MSADTQFIYGFHAVTARLRHSPDSIIELYLQLGRRDARSNTLAELAHSKGLKIVPVEGQRLDGMAGGARHQGVVARATLATGQPDLEDILADSPGLSANLSTVLAAEYPGARGKAQAQMAGDVFPATCPFTATQVLDLDFFPEGATLEATTV